MYLMMLRFLIRYFSSVRHCAETCGKFTMRRGGYCWLDALALALLSCLFVVVSQRSAQGQSSVPDVLGASASLPNTLLPDTPVSGTSLVVDSHRIESQAHYIFSVPNADVEHRGASGAVLIYTQDETASEPISETGLAADFLPVAPFGSNEAINLEQLGFKPVGIK